MSIGHRYSAEDRTNDTEKTLIGAAHKEGFYGRRAVQPLFGRTVDGTIVVLRKMPDGFRGKYIDINHVSANVRHKPYHRGNDVIVSAQFFQSIDILRKFIPLVKNGLRGDANDALRKQLLLARRLTIEIVIW